MQFNFRLLNNFKMLLGATLQLDYVFQDRQRRLLRLTWYAMETARSQIWFDISMDGLLGPTDYNISSSLNSSVTAEY